LWAVEVNTVVIEEHVAPIAGLQRTQLGCGTVTWVGYRDGGWSEKRKEQWQMEHGPGRQDWQMENVRQETETQHFPIVI